MAKTILGKVSIVPRGTWNKDTAYIRLDAVKHNGSGYIAVQDSTNIEPGTDPLAWMLLVEKGDPFTFEDFTPAQLDVLGRHIADAIVAAASAAAVAAQMASDAAATANAAADRADQAAEIAGQAAESAIPAYQAAVAGGFAGTEAEFNLYLASTGNLNAVLDAINGEVI